MIKFFKNGLILLSFVVIMNLILALIVWKHFYKEYLEVDVDKTGFILADSHGLKLREGLKENEIYNFSMGSDSYKDMYRKFAYLISKDSVKLILITADDHKISSNANKTNNEVRSILFSNFGSETDKLSYLMNTKMRPLIPLISNNGRDILLAVSGIGPMEINKVKADGSTLWKNSSYEKRLEWNLNRIKSHFGNADTSKTQIQFLEKIISECRERGITIVGIRFPLDSTYLRLSEPFNKRTSKIFERNNVPVLNYRELFKDNLELFSNGDHINENGARILEDSILNSLKILRGGEWIKPNFLCWQKSLHIKQARASWKFIIQLIFSLSRKLTNLL